MCEQGLNPHRILLNEIMTRETLTPQFVELKRLDFETNIKLDGYGLIVAETTSARWIRPNLVMRTIFDLSSGLMNEGQEFAIIGRDPSVVGDSDTITFVPSNYLRVIPRDNKKFDTTMNWLKVDPDKVMVVFLTYNSEKGVFHKDVSPFINNVRKRSLDSGFLEYVTSNMADIMVISGSNSPVSCSDINTVVESVLPEGVTSLLCPAGTETILSVNRCGNSFSEFRTDFWKPGK